MENKLVLLLVLGLVVIAVYLAATAPATNLDVDDNESNSKAVDLLLKGLSFGKGIANYNYSYLEISNDYELTYKIEVKDDIKSITVQNPISNKTVFFLSNDTILCIDYDVSVCSTVKNLSELKNYIESLEVKIINDDRIDNDKSSMAYMIANNLAIIDPETIEKGDCTEVKYLLNFSNISLDQAAKFRISSTSPKIFKWSMCIDNLTGQIKEKSFSYEYQGINNTYQYKLINFNTKIDSIIVPQNLTTGAIVTLSKEREQSVKIATCFAEKQGKEREKCISDRALVMKEPKICELAGLRRDQCLVSLIPKIEDRSICTLVHNSTFKDDCYIELSGKYKNDSYCININELEKRDFCTEIANRNETKVDKNITDILNCIDNESCIQ